MIETALLDEDSTKVPQEVPTEAHGRRDALRSIGLSGVALLSAIGLSARAEAKKKKKKKKPSNTPGPAGPQGPQGPAGSAGPVGISGAKSAFVGAQESRPLDNFDYGDLATPGPSVSVTVPQSGQVLVTISAFIQSSVAASIVSFSSSGGAGDVNAHDQNGCRLDNPNVTPIAARSSATTLISGLSPGDHTFTAQYRCTAVAAGSFFEFRNIIVIPLP